MRWPVGVHAARCRRRSGGADVSGRWRSWLAPTGPGRPSRRGRRRARPAPRPRGPEPVRDLALASAAARSSEAPSAARIVTRFVSVPNPDPARPRRWRRGGRRPCAALFRRPVQRARLGREADEHRTGRAARSRAGPARRRPRPGCPAVGSSSSVRPVAAASLRSAAVARPEVGHGGGHDERVEPALAPSPATRPAHLRSAVGASDDDRSAVVGQRPPDVGRR